jgi:hypothetical protein
MEYLLLAAALVFPHDVSKQNEYVNQKLCVTALADAYEFKRVRLSMSNNLNMDKLIKEFEKAQVNVCGPEIK